VSEPRATRPEPAGYFQPAEAGSGLLPWSHVGEQLAPARNYWVATASRDGRPHSMPVWGVWLDEHFWFSTGPTTRKARNLLENPNLVVHLESGAELVVLEGRAEEIRDPRQVERFLAAYNPKYSWDFEVSQLTGGGLFRVRPRRVFAWRGDEGDAFAATATRWTLDEGAGG
jgi:hypothetical protein